MLEKRVKQSKRSVLIHHPCTEDWVLQYCMKFGAIANAFHHKIEGKVGVI